MIDKQLIKAKILELLELNDHAKLPNGFGVCFEVAYGFPSGGPDFTAYSWCQRKAHLFGTQRDGFVSYPGYMNLKRREFCHYLLDCLDKEPDNETDPIGYTPPNHIGDTEDD